MGHALVDELYAGEVLDVDAYLAKGRAQHSVCRRQRHQGCEVQADVLAGIRALEPHWVELAVRGCTQVVVGVLQIVGGLLLGAEVEGYALGFKMLDLLGDSEQGLLARVLLGWLRASTPPLFRLDCII